MSEEKGYTLSLLRRRKSKIVIAAIIIAVLLAILLAIFIKGYTSAKENSEQRIKELEDQIARLEDEAAVYTETSKEVNISLINAEIQDIGELATIEYLYTDAGKFSDTKQLLGHDISLTTKSFIAKWDGSIKAGVKVDKVTAQVNESKKEIVIHMPKAEILSHEIDDESIETLDEKNGLFNAIEIDDVRQFDTISKETMVARAIENGILDKAFENAKDIIYRLVNTDVVEEQGYTITFQVMEEE